MLTWSASKRTANLRKHGIDLAECEAVFDAPMVTREDSRAAYGEQRLQSLCWLDGRVVVMVWTDRQSGPHIISCRNGDRRETQIYFQNI